MAREMVKTSLDTGINLFDTAEGYGLGLAEEVLGGALQELGCREKAIIVTKVGPLFGSERIDGRACNLSAKHIAGALRLEFETPANRLHRPLSCPLARPADADSGNDGGSQQAARRQGKSDGLG